MSDNDEWFDERFTATRVMVILRGLGPDVSLQYAERAWSAGVTMLEVPLQEPTDHDALAVVAAAARERELVVGAGTIVSPAQVHTAADAGAAYVVSPGTAPDVIRTCLDAGLPTLPGVACASDIQACLRLGVHWLKAFPASVLGADWFTAMRGPFPGVRFVATGGMTPCNAAEYLRSGAQVVSLSLAPSRPDQWEGLPELALGARDASRWSIGREPRPAEPGPVGPDQQMWLTSNP